jgi:2,3-bisphosphoglycerate-dependent phosphoglycerate mutase
VHHTALDLGTEQAFGTHFFLAKLDDQEYRKSMNNQLLFLRHGQSYSNVANTFSGCRDNTELTPEGEQQARQAGEKLKAEGVTIDHIIVSSLGRAQKTAHIVADSIGFDQERIVTDPRLGEYDTGEMTGKLRTGVTSAELISAPGAEDPIQFQERVKAALADAKELEGTVLLVSHAGVGRMIQAIKQGIDPHQFYDLPPYPNAEIEIID